MLNLVEGVKYTVELGSHITERGKDAVQHMLSERGFPALPPNWNWEQMVERGPIKGNLPTRIATYMFKTHQRKLDADFKQLVGNVIARHQANAGSFVFDFNSGLDWERGMFGDHGSCFWSNRATARRMLKQHQAWAVRFYDSNNPDRGIGRAWLLPNTPEEDVMLIFNGYGPWGNSTLQIAQVLAGWRELTYNQIRLTNWRETNGTMWINSGIGYLIGSAESIRATEYDLHWPDNVYTAVCPLCDGGIRADHNHYQYQGQQICHRCYHERFRTCRHCGNTKGINEFPSPQPLCTECVEAYYFISDVNQEFVYRFDSVYLDGHDMFVSYELYLREAVFCNYTGRLYLRSACTRVAPGVFVANEHLETWRAVQQEAEVVHE